jgi:hypothetical protein
MIEQELIDKVRNYLNEINLTPENGEISYTGIKKNAPQLDGANKDMHVVSFIIDFNKESAYVEGISAIYIDIKTKKLELLVTPYYMKQIV